MALDARHFFLFLTVFLEIRYRPDIVGSASVLHLLIKNNYVYSISSTLSIMMGDNIIIVKRPPDQNGKCRQKVGISLVPYLLLSTEGRT